MKRIQLFEFEDQKWFPSCMHDCLTDLIMVFLKLMGTSEVLGNLIAKVLQQNGLTQIVDLGSGSGGVMPDVLKYFHRIEGLSGVELIMTDLYPNKRIAKIINENTFNHCSYLEIPINATDLSTVPNGLKTMVNSFHHMRPNEARKILQSAVQNKQPILIYELAENKIPLLLWALFLPISIPILMIMSLVMTPFVKTLTWRRVVFTYIIPIIPLCYAWDGQASLPRMYSFKDLDILLKGLQTPEFYWEKGYAKKENGKKAGTYLVGYPKI